MAGLSHVRLFVRDLPRMRAFYETTLGFPLVAADRRSARFRAGAVDLVLEADPPFGSEEHRDFLNQLKGNMRGMGSALHFTADDVDDRFRDLAAKGVIPVDPERNRRLDGPIERDGRRGFAIEDPEGYWVFFERPMHTEGGPHRTILFVCEGNRFRSQMAEGFFNAWAPPGWRGISAGTKPAEVAHPVAVELMREAGIDISHHTPKPLDMKDARAAWRVVAMCSIDSCPVEVSEKTDRWDITDPAGLPEARWRDIREAIAERVKGLVRELERIEGLTP